MATRKTFISYDYDNDRHYRDLLLAWSKNPDFADFYFHDQPVTVPVDSSNAGSIKRDISARVDATTGLLCIVGTQTHVSEWVDWEIRKALELGKRMIAVKTEEKNPAPPALYGAATTWAQSFTFDAISKALDEAYAH
jgi:hypothetical protein